MPRMRTLLGPLLLIGMTAPGARGDDTPAKTNGKAVDPVASALGESIIGPRQTLAEVQHYVSDMVPRMPEVKTIADWEEYAARTRGEVLGRVIFRGEAARWRDARTGVEWLDTIEGGPGYRIKKLRYEALPGLWIPALLYEPESFKGKVPAVLNVNGHEAVGKAADYKQIRCINYAKRGMYALNIEWFGMGQFRTGDYAHDQINHIDLCGASGVSTHYLAMTRGIDLLLDLEHTDPEKVAVTGLSGGGWQTIFVSAFDTRVKLTNPVAGYSGFRTRAEYFSDLGDSEQTPADLGAVTDYTIMTAMMAPRAALLTFNENDNCCFAAPHALQPLLDAARPIFKLYDKEDRLRSHVNLDPGTHNYLLDNRQANYRMLGDQFYAGDAGYDPKEIPSDKEVKTKQELHVPLPDGNQSLHGLAMALSRRLPVDGELPSERAGAQSWMEPRRARLRELVSAKSTNARTVSSESRSAGGVKATLWKLQFGEWSLPVVELVNDGSTPRRTTIVLADQGRKQAVDLARRWLDAGHRVLAVDPFYIGESKVAEKDYLFALMLVTVGDRPLGLQASQVAAVARWARTDRGSEAVSVVADGPRTSVMALTATALEPDAIAALELHGSYGSLRELIEASTPYTASPELFCPGLLEHFDIAQLAALCAPRPVVFVKPSARARSELYDLKAWYATWRVVHDPLH